ncbi:hypothetical protein [Mycolicibacterium agri]|uniref:hypothetical protein n=1 Tax=Mycolicibacterium agri TaxID=36811 RepID=UPI001F452412|nr:hypothetical protein [Mycolicibacterium agri]
MCQMVADRVGANVVAGPVEATALGDAMIQARTHGVPSGDLEALRAHVADALLAGRYAPRTQSSGTRAGSERVRS